MNALASPFCFESMLYTPSSVDISSQPVSVHQRLPKGLHALLKAEGLVHALGSGPSKTPVLRNLSFELSPGERVAIVGPSGCGKSTLLSILGLLEKPDKGQVWIEGEPVIQKSDAHKALLRQTHMGFIFQFHFLIDGFTVLDNILLGMKRYQTVPLKNARERALLLLEEVGLINHAKRYPSQLSGGEQQRVAVVRALAHDPKILLADEPTGNLDEASAKRVFDLIHYLSAKKGQAVIFVTHNRAMAQACDRILKMQSGVLAPVLSSGAFMA
jgi:lipoprotein-releasing system ATP-binding protein